MSDTSQICSEPSQQDARSQATREKLCKATLETITEIGYHATTTSMIAKRAGVSRGAQTHHYPSKLDLVIAAFSYLLVDWERRRIEHVEQNKENFGIENYLQFLWDEIFNDPYYVAMLEMLLAAKGDPKLKDRLTSELGQFSQIRLSIWRSLFAGVMPDRRSETLMRMTICLFRGMSMQSSLDMEAEDFNSRIIDLWKSYIEDQIHSHTSCDMLAG